MTRRALLGGDEAEGRSRVSRSSVARIQAVSAWLSTHWWNSASRLSSSAVARRRASETGLVGWVRKPCSNSRPISRRILASCRRCQDLKASTRRSNSSRGSSWARISASRRMSRAASPKARSISEALGCPAASMKGCAMSLARRFSVSIRARVAVMASHPAGLTLPFKAKPWDSALSRGLRPTFCRGRAKKTVGCDPSIIAAEISR